MEREREHARAQRHFVSVDERKNKMECYMYQARADFLFYYFNERVSQVSDDEGVCTYNLEIDNRLDYYG